ncbi:MAG: chalcone isomerase family protein [Cellvibrionaceae bacterium]|nr:chalcone isomerase family protein [Cellvibrionaceae bacterium]
MRRLSAKNAEWSLCRVPLVLVFCLMVNQAVIASELTLNGAAYFTNQKRNYYVGGLYLAAASSNAEEILASGADKRMQLVVVKDRWSKTSWKNYWRERIAVNHNSDIQDKKVIDALNYFTTFVRGDFERGDEVVIEYKANETRIFLNDALVTSSSGVSLFNYLLRTWIGDVPPSLAFRKSILQGSNSSTWDDDREMLIGYDYPVNRKNIYNEWKSKYAQLAQNKKAAAEKRKALIAKRQAEIIAERKRREMALQKAKLETEKLQLALSKQKESQRSDEERLKIEREKQRQIKLQQRKEAEIYYKDSLQWQIQKLVKKFVSYPLWAKKFGEEGLVSVALRVDKSGKIVNKKLLTKEIDRKLVSEVMSAIKRSVKKTKIHAESDVAAWDLKVDYLFALDGSKLPESDPPLVPPHLARGAEQVASGDDLMQFKDEVAKAIQKKIRDTPALRVHRLSRDILIRAKVGTDGELKSFEFLKKTRNAILNHAIERSIRDASPFDTVYAGSLASNEVDVEVLYKRR